MDKTNLKSFSTSNLDLLSVFMNTRITPLCEIRDRNTAIILRFLKNFVMCPTGIGLYGIAHEQVEFFRLQKIYVIPRLGRFV